MTGYLTTHVLDTARGRPARGLDIDLYQIIDRERRLVSTAVTNDDGRTDEQILPAARFDLGEYELVFYAGRYLTATAQRIEGSHFLSDIPVRFTMSEASHYHVPLLLSPFGYSTYRGS